MSKAVLFKGRRLKVPKAIVGPDMASRTVLTNEPWDYVALWLRQNGKKDAYFYWDQARTFYNASIDLPLESKPLLLYYAYMNMAKALLSSKGVTIDPYHGVSSHTTRKTGGKFSISNEGVKLQKGGVAPSLSSYFGETELSKTHSLKNLFANLPYIHRTYCLTYSNHRDTFIPVSNCEFASSSDGKSVFLRAVISADFRTKADARKLPPSFTPIRPGSFDEVRSVADTTVTNAARLKPTELNALIGMAQSLRPDLHYINGTTTLWYVRSRTNGNDKIARHGATITLLAMHRLSELCRYQPKQLASLLAGKTNWLVSEFIHMSPLQFIDELSAEITGQYFMTPNVRLAS